MCEYKEVQLKSNSSTPEPEWPQHDRPDACVIATLVSLCFPSRKVKIRRAFQNLTSLFFNTISKLSKSENAKIEIAKFWGYLYMSITRN